MDDIDTGLAQLELGLDAYRVTGTATGLPMFMGMLAESLLIAQRPEQALRFQSEALTISRRTGERWPRPELLRLGAELLLLRDGAAKASGLAESFLKRSLDQARKQQGSWFELRASRSLARLLLERGEPALARDVLNPVLGQLREGAKLADVREAGELLAQIERCLFG